MYSKSNDIFKFRDLCRGRQDNIYVCSLLPTWAHWLPLLVWLSETIPLTLCLFLSLFDSPLLYRFYVDDVIASNHIYIYCRVPLKHSHICHDITFSTARTMAERKSNIRYTIYTHTSPWRVSYGVSLWEFWRYLTDRVIAVHHTIYINFTELPIK